MRNFLALILTVLLCLTTVPVFAESGKLEKGYNWLEGSEIPVSSVTFGKEAKYFKTAVLNKAQLDPTCWDLKPNFTGELPQDTAYVAAAYAIPDLSGNYNLWFGMAATVAEAKKDGVFIQNMYIGMKNDDATMAYRKGEGKGKEYIAVAYLKVNGANKEIIAIDWVLPQGVETFDGTNPPPIPQPKTFTVTIKTNNAAVTATPATLTVTEPADKIAADTPEPTVTEGYKIVGYSISGVSYSSWSELISKATIDQDTTILLDVVKKDAETYKLTFNFDQNGVEDVTKDVVKGKALGADNVPSTDAARPFGYAFIGWFSEKNGQGEAFDPAKVYDADKTFYASWVKYPTFVDGQDAPIDTITGEFKLNGKDVPYNPTVLKFRFKVEKLTEMPTEVKLGEADLAKVKSDAFKTVWFKITPQQAKGDAEFTDVPAALAKKMSATFKLADLAEYLKGGMVPTGYVYEIADAANEGTLGNAPAKSLGEIVQLDCPHFSYYAITFTPAPEPEPAPAPEPTPAVVVPQGPGYHSNPNIRPQPETKADDQQAPDNAAQTKQPLPKTGEVSSTLPIIVLALAAIAVIARKKF